MKTVTTLSTTVLLVFVGLTGCQKADVEVTSPHAKARVASTNIVTATELAPYPYNSGWVWNKSTTASVTVSCYYSMSVSSNAVWILETTKTLIPRQDFTYCRVGAKQVKLLIKYDKNAGTYGFSRETRTSCR